MFFDIFWYNRIFADIYFGMFFYTSHILTYSIYSDIFWFILICSAIIWYILRYYDIPWCIMKYSVIFRYNFFIFWYFLYPSDTLWKLHDLRLHNLPLLGQISPFKVEIFQGAVSFATHRQSTLPTEVSLTCYGRRQANYARTRSGQKL